MRALFSGICFLLIIVMGICIYFSLRSHKPIGKAVCGVLCALLPPVIGNLIIIMTTNRTVATIGYIIYFLGMNLVMLALIRFTVEYCHLKKPPKAIMYLVLTLLGIDTLQYFVNHYFHQAFTTTEIMVDGVSYWRLVPLLGQTYHRVVDYGIFFTVFIIFLVQLISSPRIYSERYSVILLAMFIGGAWQSYYIFSGTPVDRSMIGFAVFGILVFYFSLYYRPMRLLDRMLAGIASKMPEALYFFDASSRCIWANASGKLMIGLEEEVFDDVEKRLERKFGKLPIEGNDWSERRVLGAGEAASYYMIEKHTVPDDRNLNRKAGSFLSIRDNTEEQRAIQQELYNAKHDALTGLYTREYLYEKVYSQINNHPDVRYSIIFVDIKDFKLVNDIFGSEFGDYVLKSLADALRSQVPQSAVFGRLAGDTFGICVPTEDFDAEYYNRIMSGFVVKNKSVEYPVLLHIGVYEVTEKGLDASVMFDRAHMALTTIKEDYQTHIAYYDENMRKTVLWNQFITMQLEEALAKKQIQPYLQPIVDADGRVAGAEALVRWIHPQEGILPPIRFIPVFETNGMIAEVDRYMWRCACEILARWKKEGKDAFISINISPKDFYFMDVSAEIMSMMQEFDLTPDKLRIEITETVMMTDIEKRMGILNDLRAKGFCIEIDDFGSGYSSLNLLKDMPVDVLKSDMAFLSKTSDPKKAEAILHNVIHLSDELGVCPLSEGVETEEQYLMLHNMGFKLFQGYYFSRPVSVEDFDKMCFTEDYQACNLAKAGTNG